MVSSFSLCDDVTSFFLSHGFLPIAGKTTNLINTRRASRGHEAARSEKLLRLLSDRAQTLHNDRTFYSKQSYRFCFFILTVFGGKMTSQC